MSYCQMGAKIEKNYIIFSVKKNDNNNNNDSNDSNKEILYFRMSCI